MRRSDPERFNDRCWVHGVGRLRRLGYTDDVRLTNYNRPVIVGGESEL